LEVLAILAVTITRLERNELPLATNIVPFMIISLFCRMKARTLIGYLASERLIIHKLSLLDFADDTAADINMTLS
jgi:hypothetical protein